MKEKEKKNLNKSRKLKKKNSGVYIEGKEEENKKEERSNRENSMAVWQETGNGCHGRLLRVVIERAQHALSIWKCPEAEPVKFLKLSGQFLEPPRTQILLGTRLFTTTTLSCW